MSKSVTTYLQYYLPADEDDAIDPRHIPPLLDELALERLVHALEEELARVPMHCEDAFHPVDVWPSLL